MNRTTREAARIIGRLQANVLGILGEILARPENRRRLLRAAVRAGCRKEIKRGLAAFERLTETARRPGGAARPGQTKPPSQEEICTCHRTLL